MTMPDDFINSELSVNDFLEPQPKTLEYLKGIFLQLDELATIQEDEDGFYILVTGTQAFNNGTTIRLAQSIVGNENVMAELDTLGPIRFISLETSDGKTYDYSEQLAGPTNLHIETPTQIEPGLNLAQALRNHKNERKKLAELGVGTPTEGSIRQFANVVNTALRSGVTFQH